MASIEADASSSSSSASSSEPGFFAMLRECWHDMRYRRSPVPEREPEEPEQPPSEFMVRGTHMTDDQLHRMADRFGRKD